jgi:hypothetical protein
MSINSPRLHFVAGLTVVVAIAGPAAAQSVTVSAPGVSVSAGVYVPPPPPPPVVRFEAPPPLVVVSPGVQVVPDYDEEVYFVGGYYWMRNGNTWFRSRDHRGGWAVYAHPPRAIVRFKPGQYRGWHPQPRGVVVAAPHPVGGVVVAGPGHRGGVVVAAPGRGHGGGHGRGRGRDND